MGLGQGRDLYNFWRVILLARENERGTRDGELVFKIQSSHSLVVPVELEELGMEPVPAFVVRLVFVVPLVSRCRHSLRLSRSYSQSHQWLMALRVRGYVSGSLEGPVIQRVFFEVLFHSKLNVHFCQWAGEVCRHVGIYCACSKPRAPGMHSLWRQTWSQTKFLLLNVSEKFHTTKYKISLIQSVFVVGNFLGSDSSFVSVSRSSSTLLISL